MIHLDYFYVTNAIGSENWTAWVDPKTCLGTDDSKGAVGIGFKGPDRVNAADLAILCYKMHADANAERAGHMQYMTCSCGCYCDYVDVNDKEAIVSSLRRVIGILSKDFSKDVPLIKQQLPWFLINPDWHDTLLAAPARYLKRCQADDLRRRPQAYEKLQKQADRLHAELCKTVKAMSELKAQLPELPPVPSYKAV